MGMVTGGELIVRTLIHANVKHIFALHGSHLEPMFQSCRDHQIRIVDTRHEVAAGHAAEGYARAARSLGVAMASAGPGFTNIITSISNAYLDRTPVLYLCGSSALREAETNSLQSGLDQVAVARPITKWAHRVTLPQQLPRLVAQAIRMATSGPTGPVLLDIPMDVSTAKIDEDSAPIPDFIAVDAQPAPTARAVHEAIRLLRSAQRPVVMIGEGAYHSHAEQELLEFVEHTGIPVYSDFQAHGLLPSRHPLYGGTFHKMADLSAAHQRPDVVLALGVRFGLFTLGMRDLLVPRAAKIIHVEIDPTEIGRLRQVAVPIVADSRETLYALNAAAQAEPWPNFTVWQQTIRDAKRDRCQRLQKDITPGRRIHPLQAVSAIVDNVAENTIIVGDGAEAYHWLNEAIRQNLPGSYLTHGFLGAVGLGMGLAMGAQIARSDRPVLCLVGDGAVGFSLAEFDTMARHKLPIVVLVMNNHSWAAVQHFQEMVSGPDRVFGTTLCDSKYHEVAAAFGCHAQHVTELRDLGPSIKAAFASGRPACINAAIDLDPIPPELHLLAKR